MSTFTLLHSHQSFSLQSMGYYSSNLLYWFTLFMSVSAICSFLHSVYHT